MGNYANWDDVVNRYPKDNKVADAPEMSDSYITGVEASMDSYLGKVFTVPLTGEPPLLKDICIDLVHCKIAFNREKGIPDLKKAAIDLLMKIVNSEILLLDSSGTAISTTGQAVWSTTEDYDDAFSMLGTPEDLVDPDLLEDLANDRS